MPPPLYPHQVEAVSRALTRHGNLAILHEPGLGKTRTCLEIFAELRKTTPALKLLVLCPLSLIDAAWGQDITKFTSFTWQNLRKELNSDADIWVVNYETAISKKFFPQLATLLRSPVCLVVDESSRLKDSRSLTTKTVLAIAERCRHRLVCSGTPAPNGLWELWAQAKVVAPDSVPRSFFTFRRDYFHLARNGQRLPEAPASRQVMQQMFQSGWKWAITPQQQDRLLARIAPICHWVKKVDAVELPEKITTIRHVILSAEEQQAYNTMKRHLIVEFEHEAITAEIALTKLQKLQQITNGFLYGEDTPHQIGTSRLKTLLETLEELGNQPVIIWALYRQSIEQISHALGEKAVTLYGETKDRENSLRRFGTTAQYLIAHPLSAAHGLTLTQSSAAVYYAMGWSYEQYIQSQDRLHRIGQQKSCIYTHLIAPQTIDEEIWAVLERKKTLQEAIDGCFGTGRRKVLETSSTTT